MGRSTGHGHTMQRTLWLDAAILAAGTTFILFIVAEALHHLLAAVGVMG